MEHTPNPKFVYVRDYDEYPASFDEKDPESTVYVKVGNKWKIMGKVKDNIRELMAKTNL